MYERFSAQARRAMLHANRDAERLGHGYVGTQHILIGIASERDGIASSVLQTLGISVDQLREAIVAIVVLDPAPANPRWAFWRRSRLIQVPSVKRAIAAAMDEVRITGAQYVGTEHLLLGLSSDPEAVSAIALQACGADAETLRRLIADRHRVGVRETPS